MQIDGLNTAKPELLAPAGNMDCLDAALYFGADAVYLSARRGSLRALAGNFSIDELGKAVLKAHAQSAKVYLAVNALFHNADFEGFGDFLIAAAKAGVDAMIASDMGVISLIRETLPEMDIHLSTQASVMNARAVDAYAALGIKRVILARELTLEEIAEIRQLAGPGVELEAFVHGAMCMSYSGRCLMSAFLTGRSGNSGSCTQPCRWKYAVSESGREGEYMSVLEGGEGAYIFNSKDLMMIEHLDKLRDAGVSSFKIEGRMKSEYYVATAVHAYRRAIDDLAEGKPFERALKDEAMMAGTREFTTGFYFGNPGADGQSLEADKQPLKYLFAARVLGYDGEKRHALLEQRNKFRVGDRLELLSPSSGFELTVERIINEEGEEQDAAPHPRQRVYVPCGRELRPGDMLRLKANGNM